ncbi:MAG: hypothetical protein RLZZ450_5153 [Pseudomonadota bacterium]
MQNRQLVGLASVLVALLGCDEDKDGSASSAKICERVCARAAVPHCRNDLPNCESRCVSVRNDSPVDCDAQLDAFTHCALRATFTCDVVLESEAVDCAALQDAWTRCYAGGASHNDAGVAPGTQDASVTTPVVDSGLRPQSDAGTTPATDAGTVAQTDAGTAARPDAGTAAQPDAGTVPQPDAGSVSPTVDSGVPATLPLVCAPAVGDEACDTCVKGSCCTALQACGPECGAIGSCVADPSCVTQTCFDACYAAFPGGAAEFQALTLCAATTCSTACAD